MLRNIKLNRPIAFIDIETTGLHPQSDRIVELSILKIHPNRRKEHYYQRFNPCIPIPPSVTAIHNITNIDVKISPTFKQCASAILIFLDNCDISGFGITNFDLPLLETELARAGLKFHRQGRHIIDSQIIFHKREPRDLEAAYYKYCKKTMKNHHSAQEDAKVSAEILDGQIETYIDLPRDIAGLSALFQKDNKDYIDTEGKFIWVDGNAICNFGRKHKGENIIDIVRNDKDYLKWILSSSFSKEVKDIVIRALNGTFPNIK